MANTHVAWLSPMQKKEATPGDLQSAPHKPRGSIFRHDEVQEHLRWRQLIQGQRQRQHQCQLRIHSSWTPKKCLTSPWNWTMPIEEVNQIQLLFHHPLDSRQTQTALVIVAEEDSGKGVDRGMALGIVMGHRKRLCEGQGPRAGLWQGASRQLWRGFSGGFPA